MTATPASELALAKIPSKAGYPLLGNLPQIPKGKLVQFLTETSRSFDGIFELNLAGRRVLFISSADLVEQVCDTSRFRKALGPGVTMLRPLAGDGLFTAHSDEANWGKAHRILMPAFGQRAMRGYFDAMLSVAQGLVHKWKRVGTVTDIAVTDDMTRLTLDTIARCGFGYEFNSFDNPSLHPFIEAMVRSLTEALGRVTRLPIQTSLRRDAQRQFDTDNQYLHQLVDDVIAQRRLQPTGASDLLSLMLEARDPETGEALDDHNIRYQVLTFLVAGHETTSGMLSFALYDLMRNPGVLAQAYAEVDAVLPGDRVPEYGDLARLDVIDRTLKETLRLWPTAPAFSLAPFADEVIGGRYAIAKDRRVTVLTTALHRDPSVWAHADCFDIDRFLPNNERLIHPSGYKPFGNGLRACIGRQFALTEAKLALALILQNFKLNDPHDYRFRIAEALTIKPEGFVLRVSPRMPHERLNPAMADAALATAPPKEASDKLMPVGAGRSLHVAFGSSLGCAREIAGQIAQRAGRAGFDVSLRELDELSSAMPTEGLLVVVASTYNGKAPDTARKFDAAMLDELAGFRVSRLSVAVLGCGNSQWSTYQAFPARVADFFARAGATPVIARGEADADGDFDGQVDAWLARLWAQLGANSAGATLHPPVTVDRLDAFAAREPSLPPGARQLEVIENTELVGDPAGLWDFTLEAPRTSTRHLRLRLADSGATNSYRTGDHLAVYASNRPALVDGLLDRLGWDGQVVVRLQSIGSRAVGLPLDMALTTRSLLLHYLELQDVPSRAVLTFLQTRARCPFTLKQLKGLASGDEPGGYVAQVLTPRLGLPDLLKRYPAIELGLQDLLTICPPLRPRLYSISSSPMGRAGELTITVGTVRRPAWCGEGEFRGVASDYLGQLGPGERLWAAIRTPEPAFAPQADTPMILIGPGTGIAPFRGFIEQRSQERRLGAKVPPTLLFTGCRHPQHDGLYMDELLAWQQEGIVTIKVAVSAQADGHRFVQDALRSAADEVWKLWDAGAVIYVCGDGRNMAPAVRATLIAMHQERHGLEHAAASEWLAAQINSGRLRQDVFN